jgi:hypothetical protein
MRVLLSCLLATLLAVTMPMAFPGAASAAPSHAALVSAPHIPPAPHGCCTAPQKTAHGDCQVCAAIDLAGTARQMLRLPRTVRFSSMSLTVRSAALRLPLRPPRTANI